MGVNKTLMIMGSATVALVVILSFLIVGVVAEQTQQYNKIFLNPIYRESMIGDVNYTYMLNVNPPDGISSVSSAIVTFQVWHNPTIRYYLWVNGKVCNTPSFLVHTTYANAGEGTIYFDCSNVIINEGIYNVTLRPDDDTGTVSAWLDLTYTPDPTNKLEIHGTEYIEGENGTVFLLLLDDNSNPIEDAFCSMNVWYPNESLKFIDGNSMNYLDDGIYFKDFTVPSEIGVYMVNAYCQYSDILHEYNEPYEVYYDGSISTGSSNWTVNVRDADCITMKTDTGATYHEFEFNETGIGNLNISNVTELVFEWAGITSKDARLQAYNVTSASWVTLGNDISKGTPSDCSDLKWVHRALIVTNGDNISDFVNGDVVNFRIETYATSNTIWSDDVQLIFRDSGAVISDVRGSAEIHVSAGFGNISLQFDSINDSINNLANLTGEEVWNFPTRNLTWFNYTPIYDYIDLLDINMANNFTDIINRLSEINTTTQNTYTYVQGLDNHSVSDIWSHANRTLSDYNFTEILNYLYGINQTTYDIRAFQVNELSDNLTQINLFLQDINDTVYDVNDTITNTYSYLTGLVNLTAFDVWNFAQRNLTWYPDTVNYTLIQGYVWNATNRTVDFNYTPIYDYLDMMNATILSAITNANTSIIASIDATNTTLYNAIVNSNISIISELVAMNSSLYQAIVYSNSSIMGLLNSVNGTIMTKLYLMQDEIASVNDSVNSLNNWTLEQISNSTWTWGNRTLTEFNFTVDVNFTEVLDAISATNQTLYNAIIDSNTSIMAKINVTNQTIMLYLYNMTDQLDDIKDNTIQIISDVYDVQNTTDEIYNQTSEIWWLVWNLTIGNITVNANVNWTEGIEESSNISNPVVLEAQFITFAAATSPGESVTYQYCDTNNVTLINEINTSKCLFGECFSMFDYLNVTCDYGCYENKCNPEPFDKFLLMMIFFLAIIVIVVAVMLAYNRWG